MARAIWKETIIADSDDIVEVEGNAYFPMTDIIDKYFCKSTKTSYCPWKGTASYFDLNIDGDINSAAAWYYPKPKKAAEEISNRVAFWRGVKVEK